MTKLQVNGVGRSAGQHPMERRTVEVYFDRELTDDELRAFHERIRGCFDRARSEERGHDEDCRCWACKR